jgi:hypothetical protein
MTEHGDRLLANPSARVLTGRLSEHRELQTRLGEQPGLLVVAAAPWSGTSALLTVALEDLALPVVYVDARPWSNAGELARRIADAAVAALAPETRAWWTGRAPDSDPAGLRLRQALSRQGINVDGLREGAAPPMRLLAAALATAVELGAGTTVVAIDHLDRLLDDLDPNDAIKLLDALRAARQQHPDLQLVLVGRPDGPLVDSLQDSFHPMYRAGDRLDISRADSRRFVDDLAIVRPWTNVPSGLLGTAAELAEGVPFLTWQIVDLASDSDGDDAERAHAGWRRLRAVTDAQTGQTYDVLRSTHPLAQDVVVAISDNRPPYAIDANNKRVGDALSRLRQIGVAWQPRPRTWALASPLLSSWVRDAISPPLRRAVHTIRHGDGWANVYEGNERVLDVAPTKAAAQAAGRERARRDRVEHIIHRADGRIDARDSYARDPASTSLHDG